jgi:hypothetical protein
VHPAILVPGIVMIGQFGLLWLLLSAPIVAVAHDLVKYVHGRLSEPPIPAGVLPGTPAAAARRVTIRPLPGIGPAAAVTSAVSVYRQASAPRPLPRAAEPGTPVTT